MTAAIKTRIAGQWGDRPADFHCTWHQLDDGQWEIRNKEAQLEILREARRESTCTWERDEIEARRVQLRKELIAARRALHHQPLRVSTFRRFLAWLLS